MEDGAGWGQGVPGEDPHGVLGLAPAVQLAQM